MSQANEELKVKALAVHGALIQEYSQREWNPRLDPLSELVFTILSQNTSDVNRNRAWKRLKAGFPTWEEVLTADVEGIADAIRPGGLAEIKAPRIKEALWTIERERGALNLDFLKDMGVDEARDWLTSLKGVGPKTAAIVLLFSLGMPAFPVDTHVHRVSQRLGLIGPRASRGKAHVILEELLPPEIYYTFHLNMIAHGRQVCKAQKPRCEICILSKHCDYFNRGKI